MTHTHFQLLSNCSDEQLRTICERRRLPIPIRWEDGSSSSSRSSSNQKFRRRYLEQELLEVSAVGIPANPEALQLGLKAGAIEKADLRETLELLRQLAGTADEENKPSCVNKLDKIDPLLALARELRNVIKA